MIILKITNYYTILIKIRVKIILIFKRLKKQKVKDLILKNIY